VIEHLKKYLIEGADRQLQMGAVSGLSDIESIAVTDLLIESLSFLGKRNRQLAIEALLRTETRTAVLQMAVTKSKDLIQIDELESLRNHPNKTVSENAARLSHGATN
jgi:hypothetical protein